MKRRRRRHWMEGNQRGPVCCTGVAASDFRIYTEAEGRHWFTRNLCSDPLGVSYDESGPASPLVEAREHRCASDASDV